MPFMPNGIAESRSEERRAAVFIDYENLYSLLQESPSRSEPPEAVLHDLIAALHDHLREEGSARILLAFAFADFGRLGRSGEDLPYELYRQGVEARFVPAALQAGAAEMQLCVEAVDTLHRRTDLDTFFVVTGDRPYLPLLQYLRRCGRAAQVVALAPPRCDLRDEDLFLDARALLNGRLSYSARSERASEPARDRASERISDYAGLRTLELIEDYFGQYEEVYLTPLLRKMSEEFDEEAFDPKAIVSDLEAAGAVWLEKRRGFPYDYTVLLVNPEHPDVAQVQHAALVQEQEGPYAAYRGEDEASYDADLPSSEDA